MRSDSCGVSFVGGSLVATNFGGSNLWDVMLWTSSVWKNEWSLKWMEDNMLSKRLMMKRVTRGCDVRDLLF
jgi:hypothetical protein